MTLPNIDTKGLFDVSGKSAIVVGATGSFGKVACATLGNAGAKLVISAGSESDLAELSGELSKADVAERKHCAAAEHRSRLRSDHAQGRRQRTVGSIFWLLLLA